MDDEEENSYLLESQQHQGSSSSDEALRIAKVREMHTLALIHSRNQLASYTPALMLYVSLQLYLNLP